MFMFFLINFANFLALLICVYILRSSISFMFIGFHYHLSHSTLYSRYNWLKPRIRYDLKHFNFICEFWIKFATFMYRFLIFRVLLGLCFHFWLFYIDYGEFFGFHYYLQPKLYLRYNWLKSRICYDFKHYNEC